MRSAPRREEMIEYLKTHKGTRAEIAIGLGWSKRAVEAALSRIEDLSNVVVQQVPWTAAHDAMLRKMWSAGTLMAEMTARLVRSEQALYRRAITLGVRRTRIYLDSDRVTKLLDLASKPGGVGIEASRREMNLCSKLKRQGRLYSAAFSYRNVRYYSTPEAAERAQARADALPKFNGKKASKAKVGWGPGDPMHTTPQTVYTFAPKPPAQVFRTNTFQVF